MSDTSDLNISNESVDSFDSDDFVDHAQTLYSKAPKDIFGDIGNEKVLIASSGDKLPKDTKYKSTRRSTVAVKFRYTV